ncbi:MAG: zinc-ribbon domain-containing protein [Thermodesulfobacteriota bacterium]
MKVRCPKCGTVSTLDPAKIPDEGMHARCPKCNNRMFIKKPGAEPAAPMAGPPAGEGPEPASGRASEALRQVRGRREEEEADFVPPLVKPDYSFGYYGCLGLLAAVIVVCSIIIWIGLGAGPPESEVQPPPQRTVAGKEPSVYFHRDLIVLRRTLIQFGGLSYTAAGPRPECRMLFEMMSDCGRPCGRVEKAEISPLAGQEGFSARLFCEGGGNHTVTFNWGNNALIIDGERCD